MNRRGGIAFWLIYVMTLAGFIIGWIVYDSIDFVIRDTSNSILNNLNATANNNSYFTQWYSTSQIIFSNIDVFKSVYFWAGIIVLIIIPLIYVYRLRGNIIYTQ